MGRVQAMWISPHEARGADGQFPERSEVGWNLPCRLGVSQLDMLRGCENLRDSIANIARAVRTPIALPGRDHFDAATRILAEKRRAFPSVRRAIARRIRPFWLRRPNLNMR